MKKYIKPAIEVIDMDVESELMGSSHKNDPNPNTLYYFDGYSTEGGEDEDGDGLIDDM